MKKIFIIFFGVIIAALVILACINWYKSWQINKQYPNYSVTNFDLQGKQMKLLVADTEQKRELGLMNIRKLEGVDGMIFIFPFKNVQNFWNKNTLMDLKLYWVNGKEVVGTSDLPSIEKSHAIVTVGSSKPVDIVIEIPKT